MRERYSESERERERQRESAKEGKRMKPLNKIGKQGHFQSYGRHKAKMLKELCELYANMRICNKNNERLFIKK